MVQAWYQGGISVFDWTDPAKPFEIAYFDRGPVDSTRMQMGGSWSVYWYNGAIVSSEIARGMDVAELVPSQFLTKNEIDAANTVRWTHLNAQGQPKIDWPPSFALARGHLQVDGVAQHRMGEAVARVCREDPGGSKRVRRAVDIRRVDSCQLRDRQRQVPVAEDRNGSRDLAPILPEARQARQNLTRHGLRTDPRDRVHVARARLDVLVRERIQQ
jgi:hypothetical protein